MEPHRAGGRLDGYRERKDELVRLAARAAGDIPIHGHLRDGRRTADVTDLLHAFRHEFIRSMILDVALIRAMVDGETAARRFRFSAVP